MNNLAGLQQRFQQAILADTRAPDLFIDEETKLVGGFDLYRGAYRARLVAALRDNFTVLHRALGDAAFEDLAHAYIAAHPSRFRSIRWYGDMLPEFVAGHSTLVPHPALADLARMDWALRAAFDAPDSLSLTLNDLAGLPPEQWPQHRFATIDSLSIVELSWAVEPIWRALNANADAETAAPEASSHALLVWRPALECQWRAIDALEAAALRALQGGATFTAYCETIAAHEVADPATSAIAFLQRWIVDGVLSAKRGGD